MDYRDVLRQQARDALKRAADTLRETADAIERQSKGESDDNFMFAISRMRNGTNNAWAEVESAVSRLVDIGRIDAGDKK